MRDLAPLAFILGLCLTAACLTGPQPTFGYSGRSKPASGQGSTPQSLFEIGRNAWYFTGVSSSNSGAELLLSDPHPTDVHAWIRMVKGNDVYLERVALAPYGVRLIHLTGRERSGPVVVSANRTIIAALASAGAGSSRFAFGRHGVGPSLASFGPMPAPVWTFPALPPTGHAVLLTVYNPNTFSAAVTLRLGEHQTRIVVPRTGSVEVSLSQWGNAAASSRLAVRADGDVIPQRASIGEHSSRASYGTPVAASQ